MHKLGLLFFTVLCFCCSVFSKTIWYEDFEGVSVGAVGGKYGLKGTGLTGRNACTFEIVKAPAEFKGASGNAILVGSGNNKYSALCSTKTLFFEELPSTEKFKVSFDLYIPKSLKEPICGFAPRFNEDLEVKRSYIYDESKTVAAAGVYHVVYEGPISDLSEGMSSVKSARPYISMSQGAKVVDEVCYIDNIKFEIGEVEVPPEVIEKKKSAKLAHYLIGAGLLILPIFSPVLRRKK